MSDQTGSFVGSGVLGPTSAIGFVVCLSRQNNNLLDRLRYFFRGNAAFRFLRLLLLIYIQILVRTCKFNFKTTSLPEGRRVWVGERVWGGTLHS